MNTIEVLAPAGSPEQGYAAINAGCDAIYGGFKSGNARQRATNFTIEQYTDMLNYCRVRNVKFYLTLNTLLRTDELNSTIKMLEEIELPDAVIVADIGLIISIRDQFPKLPVHASTQFGAATLRDVRFLESLGVKRTILSRELTLEEIRLIKENSNIELEVFVFGTQCIMFSGQCLWGGIVSGNSGNRGKCNGMCRDFYRCGKVTGELMYPRDMEIGKQIRDLREIGVHSIKIEGRLRAIPEIVEAVRNSKKDCLSDGYAAYLSKENTFPVFGMLNSVNPRIRYSEEQAANYTEHDLLYDSDNYCWGNDVIDFRQCFYIKTIYRRPLTDGVNIAIKLQYENRTLRRIRYLNPYGEKSLLSIPSDPAICMKVSELCEVIKKQIKYSIYELISEVPDLAQISVNIDAVMHYCTEINRECDQYDKIILADNVVLADRNAMIQTNKVDDIIRFAGCGYKRFIFEITSEISLDQACALSQDIIYRLPLFEQGIGMDMVIRKLSGKKIMITRLAQLEFLKKNLFQSASADYSVNCWNESALLLLKRAGITNVAIHPEMDLSFAIRLMKKCGIKPIVMMVGRIPIGYTRACFRELGICDRKHKNAIRLTNINKGYDIEVHCTEPSNFKAVYRVGTDIAIKSSEICEKRIVVSQLSRELKSAFLGFEKVEIQNPNYIYGRNVQ